MAAIPFHGFRKELPSAPIHLNKGLSTVEMSVPTGLAIVHDPEGWTTFQETYGVQAALPETFFRTNVVLALVSLGASGTGIEAVTQRRGQPLPEYYVDVFFSGEDIEIADPPSGKKYVFVDALGVSEGLSKGTFFLRAPSRVECLSFQKTESRTKE